MLSKTSFALISAFAFTLSASALADVPRPTPEEMPAPAPAPTDPAQPAADPAAPVPEVPAKSKEEIAAESLVKRDGVIALPGGQATITVAEGFAYLDPADAEKLLTQIWGNPPSAVGSTLGIIMPKDVSPLDAKSWAAVLTYDNDGHVSDSDASSINYDDLLKEMQAGIEESNQERQKAGYETITLVGWAQKPSYDAKEHKRYWAKHLRFGTGGSGETLNFAIRALGRTGVLQVNVVGDMKQLDEINGQVPKLLSMVSFAEGHRYADYKDGDPVAAYGLAALVAGGVAAKAGLFKGLLALLVAGWKFVAIAVVAIGAVLMRFLRGMFGNKEPPAAS
jgi:uncharacterized membrane-anchored protein